MSEILNIKDAENYKLPNNNININETDKLKDEENTIDFPITSETKLDSYEDENNTKINDKSFDSQLENENNKLEIKEVNHKLEAINGNFMPSAILLEKRKIDVNEIIDSDGNTLLHLAVKYSYLNVVKTLIELFNADVNYKNNFGETPFHLVCTNERQDLFVSSYFLNLDNVDFDCQDYNGVTPLLKTIHNYYFNMFYSLVYKKCDLNHIDKEGKNIFNYSLESDNIIVLKFALKHLGVKTFKESVPNFTDTLISLNGNKCCKYLLKYYFDSIFDYMTEPRDLKTYQSYNKFNYELLNTAYRYKTKSFYKAFIFTLLLPRRDSFKIYNLLYLLKFHFISKEISTIFKRRCIGLYAILSCLVFSYLYFVINTVTLKFNVSLLIHLYQLSTILFVIVSCYKLFKNLPDSINNFYHQSFRLNNQETLNETLLKKTYESFLRNLFELPNEGEDCPRCLIKKNRKTVHCNICDRCVNNFYFHSHFLGICISSENSGYYSTLILCIWFTNFSLVSQINSVIFKDKISEYAFANIYYFFNHLGIIGSFFVLLLLISGIILFWITIELLLCRCGNVTYYLMFNCHKIPYGNIKKRGSNYYMIPKINGIGLKNACKNLIFGEKEEKKNVFLNNNN